jgi:hypothetical protein
MKRAYAVLMMLTVALISVGANADPISGDLCLNDSCAGMTFTLEYDTNNVITNGSTSTYDVFFTINTTGYTGGTADEIEAVALKITNGSTAAGVLLDAPGGPAAWHEDDSNLAANGCNSAANGFVCAEDGFSGTPSLADTDPALINGSTYTWEFSITILTGTLDTALNGASIQALFNNATTEQQTGIMSEHISLQECVGGDCGGGGGGGSAPEPQTLALLGLALVGASVARARAARR